MNFLRLGSLWKVSHVDIMMLFAGLGGNRNRSSESLVDGPVLGSQLMGLGGNRNRQSERLVDGRGDGGVLGSQLIRDW